MIPCFSVAQPYINYTTRNGLPSNHVYKIVQDIRGFIWILTDKGITKFDGEKFKTFTTKEGLPTNDIWEARVTPDDKLWFFSKSPKLGYIDRDTVYSFPPEGGNTVMYPLVILQNGNGIAFFDSKRFFRFHRGKWKKTPSGSMPGRGNFFPLLRHNKLYFSFNRGQLELIDSTGNGLMAFRKEKMKIYYSSQLNDSLFGISGDSQYYIVNLNSHTIYERTLGFVSKYVRLLELNGKIHISGKNFVGTLDENYRIDPLIHVSPHFESHQSFLDRQGNLWIATMTQGVFFIPAVNVSCQYAFAGHKVSKIINLAGKTIVQVFGKGFYEYDPVKKTFSPYITETEVPLDALYVPSIRTTFFGSGENFIKIKNNYRKEYPGLKKQKKTLYNGGKLYSIISGGLRIIDAGSMRIENHIPQFGIRDMAFYDNGKLLVAGPDGIKELRDSVLVPFEKLSALNQKTILRIETISPSRLCIGTDGFGAYIFDGDSLEKLEHSGYLSVSWIFPQDSGLWLATNDGVYHYALQDGTYKLMNTYGMNDGLLSPIVNTLTVRDSIIVAGGNTGVSIIPVRKQPGRTLLDLFFEEIKYGEHTIGENDKITYNNSGGLEVKVAAIDFSTGNKSAFEYRLLPLSEEWKNTHSNRLNFNNLMPDEYTLEIRKGDISESVRFEITPLWHQTTLARLLFAISGLFLFSMLLLLYRKREINRREQELKTAKSMVENELYALRARMNPHFVFNALNAIQYFINNNETLQSEKYLVKFSRLIRRFFDYSKLDEVSLKEEKELLVNYLQIEKMRFGGRLNYRIEFDPELNPGMRIPALLLQPIVENAVNHGIFHKEGKGTVTVKFRKTGEYSYEVCILDDGVGRKKTARLTPRHKRKKTHKSSDVLRERIDLLNRSGKWAIRYDERDLDEQNQTGTQICLHFQYL